MAEPADPERLVRLTLTLRQEDLENLPIALGYATAAVMHLGRHSDTDDLDPPMHIRVRRRLDALWTAFGGAKVEVLKEPPHG